MRDAFAEKVNQYLHSIGDGDGLCLSHTQCRENTVIFPKWKMDSNRIKITKWNTNNRIYSFQEYIMKQRRGTGMVMIFRWLNA